MAKHGLSNERLYKIWSKIKERCYNPNNISFKYYGAKNIIMENEWKNCFQNFYNWSINNGYKINLSIDREDSNGNYGPTNCRWATEATQSQNRTNVLGWENVKKARKEYNEGITIKKLSQLYNIDRSCMSKVIRNVSYIDDNYKYINNKKKII